MNLDALFNICYGLYIVSSKKGNEINGQLANTVFQITPEPATIAISIAKKNLTHEFIKESKVFTISIISDKWSMIEIGRFGFRSGRDIDKFVDCNYKIGKNGAPIVLDDTVGYVECKVIKSLDAGSHTIFLGEVTEAENLSDLTPMTYDYYHKVLRGREPKNAPTYRVK
jgi:ferric-chelate reductase [NAD(P)H]